MIACRWQKLARSLPRPGNMWIMLTGESGQIICVANCSNAVPFPFNCSHCDREISMLNNPPPTDVGVEHYRFWVEHHIECKIRSRHVTHFKTGGIFRDWNLRVTHPAVVLSPPVINELLCNYREVTWRMRWQFEILERVQCLTLLPGFAPYLGVEELQQSLMCFCTRLLCWLLHTHKK